jgi:N-acetylglutamate synthase-like GNAT family acetyltransferase
MPQPLVNFVFQNFVFNSDPAIIPVAQVHQFLNQESYWAKGISEATVAQSIAHSICIGIYNSAQELVGFGRMITDRATFAYIADVFVTRAYRGLGLSKQLMAQFGILADAFQLRRVLLTTQDAHGLYEQCGYERFPYPERLMSRPGVVYAIK